jgi:hypothetical protein
MLSRMIKTIRSKTSLLLLNLSKSGPVNSSNIFWSFRPNMTLKSKRLIASLVKVKPKNPNLSIEFVN